MSKAPPAVPWLLGFGGVGLLMAAVTNRHPLQLFSRRASGTGTVEPIYTPGEPPVVQSLTGAGGTPAAGSGSGADLGLGGGTLPGDAGRAAGRYDDYPGYNLGPSGPHGDGLYRGPKPALPPAAPDGWKAVTWNKYTGRPVDGHGLTHAAYAIEKAVKAAFPRESASWGKNVAVDRKVFHSTDPNAQRSPHAYGEACDLYPKGGSLRPEDANGLAGGDTIARWLARQMWAGTLPLSYVLWNLHIAHYNEPDVWKAGNDHETHIHANARIPS